MAQVHSAGGDDGPPPLASPRRGNDASVVDMESDGDAAEDTTFMSYEQRQRLKLWSEFAENGLAVHSARLAASCQQPLVNHPI